MGSDPSLDKGGEAGLQFPFGRNLASFESALAKQEKRIPVDAIDLIKELRPYKGGNDLLWLLHDANRHDKHRIGLVPVNVRTGGVNSFLSTWDGQALVVGSRAGQHLVCKRWITPAAIFKHRVERRPTGLYGLCKLHPITGEPLVPMGGGPRVIYENHGPGSAEGSYEFLTATPGTKFKTDFQPTFNIAFRNIGAFEREPIVHVLHQSRDLVEETLLKFQRRFFC